MAELARAPAIGYASPVTLAPHHRYTFEQYLELEAIAHVRHEFYDGEIYAMAGGTPEHAAMAATITAVLGRQLTGDCRVYSSDLRVRILATGLATYPDVTVVCGPSQRDPASPTHVVNPRLVVEVLSPSTADYDRGEKLQHYQQVPSLQVVVLVDYETERIDVWSRAATGWQAKAYEPGSSVVLTPIAAELAVDDVFSAARGA